MHANLSPEFSGVNERTSPGSSSLVVSSPHHILSLPPQPQPQPQPPPPRLPSISSLINSIPPPPERIFDEGSSASPLAPRDPLEDTSSQLSGSTRLPSPIHSFRSPTSSESHSLPDPLSRDAPRHTVEDQYRPPSASSARYGSGGPFPSTSSSSSSWEPQNGFNGRPFSFSSPHLSHDTLAPLDPSASSSHRQRSASLNTTYPPYPAPTLPIPSNYHRPHPGFATSSERRGSGSDERTAPTSSGGLGPWRNRRRAPDGPYDFGFAQPGWTKPASPTRPRALSISTADEYYLSRPAWAAPHGVSGPSSHLQFAQRRTESDPSPIDYYNRPFPPSVLAQGPPSAGVTSELSFLRLSAPEVSRGHLVPAALPTPTSTGPTPLELHPEMRSLIVPSGLPGSAPSSASSGSNSLPTPHSREGGIPTPVSAGPTSSVPSPSTSASTGADVAGAFDAAGDGGGSTESGRYGCPHCSKRFARPSSLRIHTFSHTGEKPFTCPQCERAFSVQSNLRRHLKIHKNASDQAPAPRSRARNQTRSNNNDDDSSRRTSIDMEDDDEFDAGETENDYTHHGGNHSPQQHFPSVLTR